MSWEDEVMSLVTNFEKRLVAAKAAVKNDHGSTGCHCHLCCNLQDQKAEDPTTNAGRRNRFFKDALQDGDKLIEAIKRLLHERVG